MEDFEDAPMRIRALQLLEAIRAETESANQPTFLQSVVQKLRVSEASAQSAFRYLADKRWIDTFSIPYTGRINAAGQDALENFTQEQHEGAARSAARTRANSVSLDVTMEWDVFISHAGEDKDQVARPLAKRLTALGVRVWYDEGSCPAAWCRSCG